MRALELQEEFIGELLSRAKHPWDRIEFHFERYEWQGRVLEFHTSEIFEASQAHDFPPTNEALNLLVELNRCIPQGESERWTWLDFYIDNRGVYRFDFKYGLPPLAGASIQRQEAWKRK
jgi:hypothetical protein